jgi:hypothetical protein
MKTYKEIDLGETPIAALGCGHFFTAETLDGHMGMERFTLWMGMASSRDSKTCPLSVDSLLL